MISYNAIIAVTERFSNLEASLSSDGGISIVLFQKVIGLELDQFSLEGGLGLFGGHASWGILLVRRLFVLQLRKGPLEGRLAGDGSRGSWGRHC